LEIKNKICVIHFTLYYIKKNTSRCILNNGLIFFQITILSNNQPLTKEQAIELYVKKENYLLFFDFLKLIKILEIIQKYTLRYLRIQNNVVLNK
jgi:hypothetical protein